MSAKLKLIEPMVGVEEVELIQQVISSGHLTEGRFTREFETKVSAFLGARHAIATTSCTTALELCLRAIGVGAGDEVIVPDFTHPATACAVAMTGARPVLIDVNLESYNLDPDQVERAISQRTRCVIPVSLFGNPVNMHRLDELKERYGFYIIEDAACSLGAEIGGRKTGTLAGLTCFSFHPRKVVTVGEGGMITTDDDELAESLRSLKNFGIRLNAGKIEFRSIGTNYKLSDILGAVGVKQMEKASQLIQTRIELAHTYNKLLEKNNYIEPPKEERGSKHVYQTYAPLLKVDGIRDELITCLGSRGIEAQVGTYALHLQRAFQHCRRVGKLLNSALLHRNLIALPLFHRMSLREQQFVVDQMTSIVHSPR